VGADAFVSGTGLFGQRSLKTAVKKMRKLVTAAHPAAPSTQSATFNYHF
jgi:hypothetical protein